jgi:peptide deformylase
VIRQQMIVIAIYMNKADKGISLEAEFLFHLMKQLNGIGITANHDSIEADIFLTDFTDDAGAKNKSEKCSITEMKSQQGKKSMVIGSVSNNGIIQQQQKKYD